MLRIGDPGQWEVVVCPLVGGQVRWIRDQDRGARRGVKAPHALAGRAILSLPGRKHTPAGIVLYHCAKVPRCLSVPPPRHHGEACSHAGPGAKVP